MLTNKACLYNFNSDKLFIASSFNLSTARVYFSVYFNSLWPNKLATVLMLAPLFRMFTAKLWRAQCQLMCLLMPARFTQRFTDLQQLSYDGKLNMEVFKSSGASPISESNPSFRGMTTPLYAECPLVLLFKFQKAIGIIYILRGKVFYTTEAQTAI